MKQYQGASGEVVVDSIRLGLVMANLGDERIRNHLQLNASRITTWSELRAEVREIAQSSQKWPVDQSTPMDVDAVYHKGGKGKSKPGKGKGEKKGQTAKGQRARTSQTRTRARARANRRPTSASIVARRATINVIVHIRPRRS